MHYINAFPCVCILHATSDEHKVSCLVSSGRGRRHPANGGGAHTFRLNFPLGKEQCQRGSSAQVQCQTADLQQHSFLRKLLPAGVQMLRACSTATKHTKSTISCRKSPFGPEPRRRNCRPTPSFTVERLSSMDTACSAMAPLLALPLLAPRCTRTAAAAESPNNAVREGDGAKKTPGR